MFKFYKPMLIASCLLWTAFIFHVLALEVFGLLVDTLLVSGIITIVLLVLNYSFFVYYYFKNKTKINNLKKQYLDSLKPDKPLRFCPTDEELLRKYQEQEKNRNLNQEKTKEDDFEDTDEEEIEM